MPTAATDRRAVRPSESVDPLDAGHDDRLALGDRPGPLDRALDAIDEELARWRYGYELEELDDLYVELEGSRESEERRDVVTGLCAEVRDTVGATLEHRDPHVARAFRGGRIQVDTDRLPDGPPEVDDDRLDASQVVLVLHVWLVVARKRHVGLAEEVVAWVRETLGESGPDLERAARLLRPAGEPAFERSSYPDEADIPALIWLLAGVVAVRGAEGISWLEGLDAVARGRDA